MNGKCGVCDRPKGRGYGECSAPDSTDYTVSILCLSVALQNARAEVATAEERGRRRGVEAKDAAYAERNQCVALIVRMALAHGWRAGVRDHEDKPGEAWEADWRNLVCIDLPTGQVSWHFHDSEKHLLAGLPRYPASWDGHDTAEKYRRVNAALAPRDSAPVKVFSRDECPFNYCDQEPPRTACLSRCRHEPRDSGKEGA